MSGPPPDVPGADEVGSVLRVARVVVAAVAVLPAVLLAVPACTGSGGPGTTERSAPSRAVVVASFDFPESELVAEIYAQALVAAGIPVRRERALGPRELVQPALQQGLVDVVPEYLGTALASVAPGRAAAAHDVPAARAALDAAIRRWGLRTLTPSTASDQNGVVVTTRMARDVGLHTVSDLRGQAPLLTFGATPECARRPYCLVGLREVYGLRFGHVVALESEALRAAALQEGVVDVALLFTTDGRLAAGDLRLLVDDRRLQPAENLLPMVSQRAVDRYGERLTGALDAVSARLTTANLRFLNWRVDVAHRDVSEEARGWLLRHGLVTRSR